MAEMYKVLERLDMSLNNIITNRLNISSAVQRISPTPENCAEKAECKSDQNSILSKLYSLADGFARENTKLEDISAQLDRLV